MWAHNTHFYLSKNEETDHRVGKIKGGSLVNLVSYRILKKTLFSAVLRLPENVLQIRQQCYHLCLVSSKKNVIPEQLLQKCIHILWKMCLSAVVDRMLLKYFMMQYSLETNFFFILLPHTPPQVGKKSSKFDTPLKKFLYNPEKFWLFQKHLSLDPAWACLFKAQLITN